MIQNGISFPPPALWLLRQGTWGMLATQTGREGKGTAPWREMNQPSDLGLLVSFPPPGKPVSGSSNLSAPVFQASGFRECHGGDILGLPGVGEINIGNVKDTWWQSHKNGVLSVDKTGGKRGSCKWPGIKNIPKNSINHHQNQKIKTKTPKKPQ